MIRLAAMNAPSPSLAFLLLLAIGLAGCSGNLLSDQDATTRVQNHRSTLLLLAEASQQDRVMAIGPGQFHALGRGVSESREDWYRNTMAASGVIALFNSSLDEVVEVEFTFDESGWPHCAQRMGAVFRPDGFSSDPLVESLSGRRPSDGPARVRLSRQWFLFYSPCGG